MRTKKSVLECESETVDKWSRFKLPNKLKPIGWIIAITSFIAFLFTRNAGLDNFLWLFLIKNIGVLGLAMVTLSKEKIEDEMLNSLRGKAMLFTLFCIIFFIILTPFITVLLSGLITDDFRSTAFELSQYNTLSCVMLMYILGFETMKRLYK